MTEFVKDNENSIGYDKMGDLKQWTSKQRDMLRDGSVTKERESRPEYALL